MRARGALVTASATACALAVTMAGAVAAQGNSDPQRFTAVITAETEVDIAEPGFSQRERERERRER